MSPGCGPECVIDPDCEYGYVCSQQRCIERPDPCDPSPCGPGTTCTANRDGNPICRCLPGLVPKPDTITGEHLYFTLSWFWVFNGYCKCRVEPEGGRMPPKPSSDQMQENYEPVVILPRKVMPAWSK